MAKNEDTLPGEYQYLWSKGSNATLSEFLGKYKPSMVQNDGTKPWIWVEKSQPEKEDTNTEAAIEEAGDILKEITERVESIKNDASIPARSSKKTGAKGKKEVREEAQAEATTKLKEAAIKHGYVSGKWLIFASADKVDAVWSQIANSLVSGPLSSTSAYLAKVATSPQSDTPNYQHLICVYMPDAYDKEKVTEIMKVLLRNHGLSLSGVKSNLYTILGIDSKHASGLQSTTWKNAALMTDAEMKEMKDTYFAELKNKPTQPEAPTASTIPTESAKMDTEEDKPSMAPAAPTKGKPKLKKKVKDDPFASEGEEEEEGVKDTSKKNPPAKKAPAKKAGAAAKRKQSDDDDSDDDTRPKKKFTV